MPARARVATDTRTRHAATRGDVTLAGNPGPQPEDSRRARRPKAEAQARRAGPEGPALGNRAKTASTAGKQRDRSRLREDRYRARSWLSTVRTGLHQRRWRNCGRAVVEHDQGVLLQASTGKDGITGGFGGLTHCGSVWACPVCSARISAQRTDELDRLLRWNAQRGGTVSLATFTLNHHQGQSLRYLRTCLFKAWRHMTQHRRWKESRARLGMDAYVRAVEATLTEEGGWHPHIHVLCLFDGPVPHEAIEEWTDELYQVWSAGLAKSGMGASRKHGVDVRQGDDAVRNGLGKYLAKLAYEGSGGRLKKKRKNNPRAGRTPYELLDDALTTGNADDWDRWFEWEKGSKGMQQLLWSNGLKDRVAVEEVSDEEAAEEQLDGETVATISAETWGDLYWRAAEVLTALEHGGPQAARDWLDWHGYRYIPGEVTPDEIGGQERLL